MIQADWLIDQRCQLAATRFPEVCHHHARVLQTVSYMLLYVGVPGTRPRRNEQKQPPISNLRLSNAKGSR